VLLGAHVSESKAKAKNEIKNYVAIRLKNNRRKEAFWD
jgi:hypothetical protein